MQIHFIVEEAPIVTAHDIMFSSDEDLARHVSVINAALNLLARLPKLHEERNPEELALLRLAIRCFNSGGAALRLLRCGYFQPAMTMVRDLIEVSFLLSLFSKEPKSLTDWLSMSDSGRKKQFKPVEVRKRLDKIDGYVEKKRQVAYDLLSQHAAHANPCGYHLISPEGMTRIGPFSDYKLLRAGVEELAKYLTFATVTFSGLVQSDLPKVLQEKATFIAKMTEWHETYLSPAPNIK